MLLELVQTLSSVGRSAYLFRTCWVCAPRTTVPARPPALLLLLLHWLFCVKLPQPAPIPPPRIRLLR